MLYKHIPRNILGLSLLITPGECYLFITPGESYPLITPGESYPLTAPGESHLLIEADVTAGSTDVAAGASARAGNGWG